jgi:hypothetical protein
MMARYYVISSRPFCACHPWTHREPH